MIVWQIQGDGIGPNECGAHYFAFKSDADSAAREWLKSGTDVQGPYKLKITDRYCLAQALNDAMGFGGS